MPEKVRLAQTLVPNVNTCMGWKGLNCWKQPYCTYSRYRTLLSLSSFSLSSGTFLPLFAAFPAVTVNAGLQIFEVTEDNNRPSTARICSNCGSVCDVGDYLESPRLLWFMHDNSFLKSLEYECCLTDVFAGAAEEQPYMVGWILSYCI